MIGTLRRELLDRALIINERHLRRILVIYLQHFNTARPHRALAQLAPAQAETQPPKVINLAHHQIRRRPILNGLTSEYQIPHDSTRAPANPQAKPKVQYSSPTRLNGRSVALMTGAGISADAGVEGVGQVGVEVEGCLERNDLQFWDGVRIRVGYDR